MSIPHGSDQANGRKALNEAFDRQSLYDDGIARIFSDSQFCGNPAEYVWTYVAKKDVLISIYCDAKPSKRASRRRSRDSRSIAPVRWELHPVWIVEGTLRAGESNLLAKRRFYIDQESWQILMGEGFDRSGNLVNAYMLYKSATADKASVGKWHPVGDRAPNRCLRM